MSKKKTPRKLNLKTRLFIQYLTDTEQIDKEGKHTFGNQKRSYALAYNRQPDNTAAVKATNLVIKGNVQSELESLAESMEFGVKVRMRGMADIAAGRTLRTVKSKQYSYSTDPKTKKRTRVLVSMSETIIPTKDSDRIKSTAVANKMTGLDAMQAGVKALAIREARELYDRIVKPGRREKPAMRAVQAVESTESERTIEESTDYAAEFLSECSKDT